MTSGELVDDCELWAISKSYWGRKCHGICLCWLTVGTQRGYWHNSRCEKCKGSSKLCQNWLHGCSWASRFEPGPKSSVQKCSGAWFGRSGGSIPTRQVVCFECFWEALGKWALEIQFWCHWDGLRDREWSQAHLIHWCGYNHSEYMFGWVLPLLSVFSCC